MPLIIDANRGGDFFSPPRQIAAKIIKKASQRQVKISIGGRLLDELLKTPLRGLIAEWEKSGIARKFSRADIEAEEKFVGLLKIKSDDPHVLALSRVSNTNLLYTEDKNLIIDFKDPKIINPKGKIFHDKTKENVADSLLDRYGK